MNLSFNQGISAVNALRDEYDTLCVEVIKRKSREENLKLFISEKEGKIVELKREYVQLDEKLNSTERQVESIEATIGHYHDIKRSLVADVKQKEENLEESRRKLSAQVDSSKKDIEEMQSIYDHAMNEIWSKQPGFSDMMGLAKRNLEIDAQIEAAIKRNEDMNRAIAEAEYIANQQGSRLEHHTWMQGELQKLEERNCQKMAALKNLEEKISTLEKEKQEKMVKNAMAKQQQNLARLSPQTNVLPATREVPAIAANQKGDNNDDINDSGMDTMYFQDSPEKEDFNRTAEVLGPRPGPAAQSTPAVMDSLKGLVDTVKVNKIMLESNHGQPVESPIAQRKSITNLPCYKGSPSSYENPNVFKTPKPTAYQNPNSYENQDVFKTPRQMAQSTSTAPFKSPNNYENRDEFKTPKQTTSPFNQPPTMMKSRSQRRLLVEGEEDQSFSFHEESSAAGNFASENMGNISAQPSIFDAPSEHIPRMSPGLNKVSPGVKTAGSTRGSPAVTVTPPSVASGSQKSPENSSPGAFGGFGAGSSSSKFDFFNSAGGMFGGGTGSTQEENGNGSGVNDDYQAGSSFPAFNFTGLDSMSKPSGGNDMGGFGFNF